MGNQLFQYAAGKSLAFNLGTELVIDARHFQAVTEADKMFRLGEIGIPEKVKQLRPGLFKAHGLPLRAYRWLKRERRRHYVEPRLGYFEDYQSLQDGAYLVGCFQSPKYFAGNEDRIFADTQIDEAFSKIEPRSPENAINVHVRRGDYLANPGYVLTDPLAYYREALAAARKALPHAPLVVFSDDIPWCREQDLFAGAQFMEPIAGESPWADLVRMSRCAALVIANSSYSWWAGWFAMQRGAQVYCPRQWIKGLDSADLHIYPDAWTVIGEA
ncbi:hypothetical protein GRI62_07595 [Erythrobacter arachoides]|uniref:Alpha-1,2-fucosyltransferase n=1 Tax=Aurantiacibacter arachoides TaxID=1850444 RepID=A0A845A0J1_9SPHN|nr:alpha-1,2-fucosyltransferase [Aurantiacibacter arachoides]MXO93468.1 hypothetical protein [Aurantiacibacter arachoides]GGD49148.1 alpha-1,2-fucosyltransferase [Aurantiacibacter arachoides]